jgi:hypothetical protein
LKPKYRIQKQSFCIGLVWAVLRREKKRRKLHATVACYVFVFACGIILSKWIGIESRRLWGARRGGRGLVGVPKLIQSKIGKQECEKGKSALFLWEVSWPTPSPPEKSIIMLTLAIFCCLHSGGALFL